MTEAQFKKKSMSLKEVLEAAAYAEKRVDSWPEWKRELSFHSLSPEHGSTTAQSVAAIPGSTKPDRAKGR